jgi:hypothetical protein
MSYSMRGNNITYQPGTLLPKYTGHVPETKFMYGETYGHASEKHFQNYRSSTLNSSKSLYARGGYFPSSYSNNPDSVIANRSLSRDRFLFTPKYELNNYNYDRTQELNKYYQQSQLFRQSYKHINEDNQVNGSFRVPITNQESYQSQLPL